MKQSLRWMFRIMISRELKLMFRQKRDVLNPLIFFCIVLSLFPLALSSNGHVLQSIGPGLIWVSALLASMQSTYTLFRDDTQDGSLEQIIASGHPVILYVTAKLICHWCVNSFFLLLLTPLFSLWFGLTPHILSLLILTLLLGTPLLNLIGGFGSALTINVPSGGLFQTLITLPLLTPVLIFATLALNQHQTLNALHAEFAILTAILFLGVAFLPLAIVAILHNG